MKLVILPLDSRPCTREFPAQLAQSAGISACIPPLEVMDWYRTPSDFCRIAAWLEEACAGAGALICSLDQLAYGGLLALALHGGTRASGPAPGGFPAPPQAKIPCAGYLPLKRYHAHYSKHTETGRSGVVGKGSAVFPACRTAGLRGGAPPRAAGGADSASCAANLSGCARQKPSGQPGGCSSSCRRHCKAGYAFFRRIPPHRGCTVQNRSSFRRLQKHRTCRNRSASTVEQMNAPARLWATWPHNARPGGPALRLYVEWLAGDMQFTARYEDRPFAENLDAYLKTCRIMRVQSPKDAQAVLAVYAPSGPQMDLAMAPEDAVCAYTPGQLGNIAERLQALMDTGLPTGLLDVYHANGGESSLLRLAAQSGLLARLAAYAGWNTACNSLGTILGQLLAAGAGASPAALCSFYSRAPAGRLGLSGYCAPPMEQGTSGRGHRYLGPAGRAGRQRPPATADGTYP